MIADRPEQHETYILIGAVTRPHGLRGELKVRPFTEQPGNFKQYRRLFLSAENDLAKSEYTSVDVRANGSTVILRLKECVDRERAEQLAGFQIWLASSDLPPAEDDTFYLHTLEGKQVMTGAGQTLGTVRGFLGSVQDVLIISDGNHEYLVPAIREFIVTIDETEIVLDLPPGLLEINR